MTEHRIAATALGHRLYHGLEVEIPEAGIQDRSTEEVEITFPDGKTLLLKHLRPRDQRFEVIYFDDLIGNAKFSFERLEVGKFKLTIPEQWLVEMPEWAPPTK